MLTRFRSLPGLLFKPVQHPELLSYPAPLMVFLLLHLIVYKCTSALSSLPPPTFISLWRQKLLSPSDSLPLQLPQTPDHPECRGHFALGHRPQQGRPEGFDSAVTAWGAVHHHCMTCADIPEEKKPPCSTQEIKGTDTERSVHGLFWTAEKNNAFMSQIRCSDLKCFHVENLTRWTSDKQDI